MLAWQSVDVNEDPDEARYECDPAELYIDLAELTHRPQWMADAACREHPELSWFPRQGGDLSGPKAVCAGCLVRDECYAFSLEQGSWLSGIWAGTSERQRRRERHTAA